MTFPERKKKVLKLYLDAFQKYNQVIFVDLMNISTNQLIKTRKALRENAALLIVGKNTLARLAINVLTEDRSTKSKLDELKKQNPYKPELKKLLPYIKNKIGYIFSNKSYVELKPIIEKEIIKVQAKAGAIAPSDIWLRVGPTHQDPGKISEFQRIGIQVKAVKGSLEIIKDFKLCTTGDIVTESVSYMCRLLGIIPFEYALELLFVYKDNHIIPKEVIAMNDEDILQSLRNTYSDLTKISMGANLPNSLSVPHMLRNTFKNVLSIGLGADYKFKALEEAMNA